MRLLEAILEANHRAVAAGAGRVELAVADHLDALPLVALTCIDARLNPLIPERLGVPEEKFIWLRNAGNIITGPLSSTMRSLALACAVKGGREIAVIGHSDCLVAKSGTMQLLEGLARLGVERAKLPENLNEFFGVFSSERQNIIKGCQIIRSSPLVGPKVPVHGLLLDVVSGRLEWLVNGYAEVAAGPASFNQSLSLAMERSEDLLGKLPDFKLGELKFPESKIGEVVTKAEQFIEQIGQVAAAHPQAQTPKELAAAAAKDFLRHIVKSRLYKVVGDDKKIYGPISGEKVLAWLAEDRIDAKSLVQTEGSTEWVQLEKLGDLVRRAPIPLPPPLAPKPGFGFKRPGKR